MRFGQFTALGALLLAGTAFYFSAASGPKNLHPLPIAAAPSLQKSGPATVLPSFSDSSAPAAAKSSAMVASSVSLQTFLPGVKEHPADWRQFQPETITFEPLPGQPVTFTREHVKDEGKYVTWTGRNPGIPGSSFVAVGTAKRYDALMVLPGLSQFSVHVDPDGHTFTQEADPGSEGCGVDAAQPNRPAAMTTPAALYQVVSTAATAPNTAPPATTALTAPFQVDVLFIYDAATLAAAKQLSSDPAGYIDGVSKSSLEMGNIVLAQSLVTSFQWRYLRSEAAPTFTQTGKLGDDLDAMSVTIEADGTIDDTGEISGWVQSERFLLGADQVMLWHGGTADFGGDAYANSQVPVNQFNALSVSVWGQSYKTVIHELAHNFGCRHDRANATDGDNNTGTPVPDGNGLYCYGQLWTNPAPIPNYPYPNTASTIMGYGSAIIPYYSNPTITLQITSLLAGWPANVSSWGTQPLGVAVDQPRAAYNAKVLQDTGPYVSTFMGEISSPQIVTQPTNVTAVAGQPCQLTVATLGGFVEYQWFKDGKPLPVDDNGVYTWASFDYSPGLTFTVSAPTPVTKAYSITAATSADAGTYYVIVSNRLGSVTSTSATVTVSGASVTPPPATSTPTGGGGGGGANDLWFIGALSLLVAGRGLRRSRR